MSARSLPSPFVTALQQPGVEMLHLLDLGFDGVPQYLTSVDFDVVYAGHTYSPLIGVVKIDDVSETAETFEALRLTISGVPQSTAALFLTNKVRGRELRLRTAVISAGSLLVDDAAWAGKMDAAVYTRNDDGTVTWIVDAEHEFASWNRPQPIRFTNAWLQGRFPGDRGLEYIEDMANKRIIFPSKEALKV